MAEVFKVYFTEVNVSSLSDVLKEFSCISQLYHLYLLHTCSPIYYKSNILKSSLGYSDFLSLNVSLNCSTKQVFCMNINRLVLRMHLGVFSSFSSV